MAKTHNADIADETSSDLALALMAEFAQWFQALGAKGVLPRAFTGVTKSGDQAVIILTGLPLDDVQRRELLIWLCRNEEFVAYAYGTHVGIANDSSAGITEGLDIYASSDRYDTSMTLRVERRADGNMQLFEENRTVLPAKQGNGLFSGLQRSSERSSSENDKVFREIWGDLKSKAMWRQRYS